MNNKFKIGDQVVNVDHGGSYCVTTSKQNFVGKVVGISDDLDLNVETLQCNASHFIGDKFWVSAKYFKVIGKVTDKDDLVRYMVYGTNCDNKSGLVRTEEELKKMINTVSTDTSWTGRIIGYKLTPVFEAVTTTTLRTFRKPIKRTKKLVKKSKVKRGPGRPKKVRRGRPRKVA